MAANAAIAHARRRGGGGGGLGSSAHAPNVATAAAAAAFAAYPTHGRCLRIGRATSYLPPYCLRTTRIGTRSCVYYRCMEYPSTPAKKVQQKANLTFFKKIVTLVTKILCTFASNLQM